MQWTIIPRLRWTMLRDFGSSRVLKTSYFWLLFVPLAARALARVKQELALTIFGDVFNITFGLPFTWQIFYYAAISFSIAGILYSWRCPAVVKRYASFPAFLDEGRGVPYLQSVAASISHLARSFDQHLDRYESSPDQYRRDRMGEMFWLVYNAANHTKLPSLAFCFAFYFIGFLLFGWVLVENFLFVVRITLNIPEP